jgi:hypothetical protein
MSIEQLDIQEVLARAEAVCQVEGVTPAVKLLWSKAPHTLRLKALGAAFNRLRDHGKSACWPVVPAVARTAEVIESTIAGHVATVDPGQLRAKCRSALYGDHLEAGNEWAYRACLAALTELQPDALCEAGGLIARAFDMFEGYRGSMWRGQYDNFVGAQAQRSEYMRQYKDLVGLLGKQ